MRLVVFGAGAVGSLLGARLSAVGVDVHLIARGAQLAALVEGGVRVLDHETRSYQVPSTSDLANVPSPGLVVLTVKSYDVPQAGHAIASRLAEPVPVLALQNGLGIEESLRAGLSTGGWANGAGPILRGVNSLPVTLVRPGEIREGGTGELVLPGNPPDRPNPSLVEFYSAARDAGLPIRLSADISREVWRKLLVNAAINPVTADHAVLNGALVQEPLRGQAELLLREAQRVAASAGYRFDDEEADRELWRVVRATAANRSSMLQDIDHGRPTEVEAICGALVAEGRKRGIALPATERALRRIREKVGRAASAPGARNNG